MTKRRIGRDPGTEQRTRFGEIDKVGNMQDEIFFNNDEC